MENRSVYVTGFYGAGNFGDEAVLYALLDSLERAYDNLEVFVESSNPDLTSSQHGVKAIPRFSQAPKTVVSAINSADELVIGGGTLIKPYFYLRVSLLSIIGKLTGTKITWYCLGVEPPKTLIDQRMYKSLSAVADRITVRDQASKREITNLSEERVAVVPDPVFNTDPLPLVDYSQPESYIAVVIRDYPPNPLDTNALAATLDQLAQRTGICIKFVPYQDREDDRRLVRTVGNSMNHEYDLYDGSFSVGELHSLTANADLVVGMRLHSIVIAAAHNIPFVTLSYKPKCRRVASQIGDTSVYNCASFDPQDIAETASDRLENNNDLLMGIDGIKKDAGKVWNYSIEQKESISDLLTLIAFTGFATSVYFCDRKWPPTPVE